MIRKTSDFEKVGFQGELQHFPVENRKMLQEKWKNQCVHPGYLIRDT